MGSVDGWYFIVIILREGLEKWRLKWRLAWI